MLGVVVGGWGVLGEFWGVLGGPSGGGGGELFWAASPAKWDKSFSEDESIPRCCGVLGETWRMSLEDPWRCLQVWLWRGSPTKMGLTK